MAEITQTIKPIRLELDSSEELRTALNAQIIANVRSGITNNSQYVAQGNSVSQGSNEGNLTPNQSTELLCDIQLPTEGENVCTGVYKSHVTKEIYWEIFNTLGNHTLWVSDMEAVSCRKVYQGVCLGFRFEPEYHVPEHRATLYVIYDQGSDGVKTIRSKYYLFTDGYNWQFFIDVETSIATDSFNATLYPYWRTFYPHCDPCEYIQLGFRPPQTCVKVLPFDDAKHLQYYVTPPEGNNLKEKPWYFRVDFVGSDGRHSVMSPISTLVFLDGGDCAAHAEDIKCFRLVIPAGSALVEKIRVYFSNDGVNWFLYDTIDKWDNCMSPQPANFWERDIALKNYYAPQEDYTKCCWDMTGYPNEANPLSVVHIDYDGGFIEAQSDWGSLQDIVDLINGAQSDDVFFVEDNSICVTDPVHTYDRIILFDETPTEVFRASIDCTLFNCNPTGQFATTVYTWDFSVSPAVQFGVPFSIVINGQTYTSGFNITELAALAETLSQLGFGSFQVLGNTIVISSTTNVYGDITPVDSPPQDPISPIISLSEIETGEVNTFIYQFCGNKHCEPVSRKESDRIFDELPIASQAQTPIDNRIAFANNQTGYDNFICPIENVNIAVVQDAEGCEAEMVDYIIDAVIHNPYKHINNFIYSPGGSQDVAFGGIGVPLVIPAIVQWEDEVISSYHQQILNPYVNKDGGYGFIGGFRGTNFKAVSQQYRITDLTKTWFFNNVGHNHSTKNIMQDIINGNYVIQRFKIRAPKGMYVFEIYSHYATSFDDCAGTSTYFLGTIQKGLYTPFGDIDSNTNRNVRELLINGCSGGVTYPDYIVISDLTNPKTDFSAASDAYSIAGYLREKDTNIPIELAQLHSGNTLEADSFGTDANGFYFATDNDSLNGFELDLKVLNPDDCNLTNTTLTQIEAHSKELLQVDVIVNNYPTLANFNSCGHEIVSGTVKDCDGKPLQGVSVVLTRTGEVGVTDSTGTYRILAHDDANRNSQNGDTRKDEAEDYVMISQQGICLYNVCDTCDTCIPAQLVEWTNSCFQCPEATDINDFVIDILSGVFRGLKTGGSYEVVIIGFDYLDRNNSAQRIGFFTVPTIQSNGVYAPYHFQWSVGQLNLPPWVAKIRYAVRVNEYEFLLSWAANKVEFLNASGNITAPANATNIKIYFDGLNDFNTQHFFNTTTKYGFVEGDRIRFVANGDGSTFTTTANNGLIDLPVSSLVDGNSILIPFDSRLIGLTANAIFELYRVPVCTTEPVYLEQCDSIPVLFNETTQTYEPTVTSGVIPFYDTYWYFRAIPQTDKNGVPSIFISTHRFEHHSPSDFWGDHKFTTGRFFVRNENAHQAWLEDEIVYSDVLLENGVYNGLSTFRPENKKNYFTPNCGGIVALRAHTGLMFILYENYYDIINISQNLLMVTADGNIQANSEYLGNRQQKIAIVYGCDLRDTNTIIFHNEWLSFVDVKRGAVLLSNYTTMHDITRKVDNVSEGNVSGYFIEKLQRIAQLREQNQYEDSFMYLHSGFYPKKNEIVITSFARAGSPLGISYANLNHDYIIDEAETISFNLAGFWSGIYGFTPEAFIDIGSGAQGNQIISFVQGKPYIHDRIKNTGITYLNYYGTQVEPVIKFVFNGGEGKNTTQKKFLSLRILCKQSLFMSDEVWTQTSQQSAIPIEEFEMIENYSEGAFLCDLLTVQPTGLLPLIDGDELTGSWIKMRILIDPANTDKYFEISGFVVSAVESF